MKIIHIRDESKFVRLSHVHFADPEPEETERVLLG